MLCIENGAAVSARSLRLSPHALAQASASERWLTPCKLHAAQGTLVAPGRPVGHARAARGGGGGGLRRRGGDGGDEERCGEWRERAVRARLLEFIEETIRLARDLARRGEVLRSVAPKWRAKGSDAAVELFLTEDAVAPASMLSPRIRGTSISMTSRAARRFCDRLVELGVARGLTVRPTFRLYGL